MQNEKLRAIRDYIVRHYKIAFPVLVIAAVAATVAIALNARREKPAELTRTQQETAAEKEVVLQQTIPEVPLVENEDGSIYTLIATYYNAVALGDTDTIQSITDEVTDMELIRYQVTAQYIENYPVLEIYTKPGPEEGSAIAYVYYKVMFQNQAAEFPGYQAYYICTDENGAQYIKRGENSEEVLEYIKTVNAQADVVEFNNKITEEYNALMLEQPELLEYLSEFDEQVNKEVGVILAKQQAEAQAAANAPQTEAPAEAQNPENTEAGGEAQPEAPQENASQYAVTTTTVNVRASDSEQADKLGKAEGGTTLQVLEQRANGWSKVLFEGQEGFIKSEYLQAAGTDAAAQGQSADGVQAVGTVTATTNINVRASASESADKLGILSGGDTAELIANDGEWSRIRYNGQVGYVKSEYIQ